jgi:hypothetical protein
MEEAGKLGSWDERAKFKAHSAKGTEGSKLGCWEAFKQKPKSFLP